VNRVSKSSRWTEILFTALMVIGDGKVVSVWATARQRGRPGVQKGIEEARKNLFDVPLAGTTIVYQ